SSQARAIAMVNARANFEAKSHKERQCLIRKCCALFGNLRRSNNLGQTVELRAALSGRKETMRRVFMELVQSTPGIPTCPSFPRSGDDTNLFCIGQAAP